MIPEIYIEFDTLGNMTDLPDSLIGDMKKKPWESKYNLGKKAKMAHFWEAESFHHIEK